MEIIEDWYSNKCNLYFGYLNKYGPLLVLHLCCNLNSNGNIYFHGCLSNQQSQEYTVLVDFEFLESNKNT